MDFLDDDSPTSQRCFRSEGFVVQTEPFPLVSVRRSALPSEEIGRLILARREIREVWFPILVTNWRLVASSLMAEAG